MVTQENHFKNLLLKVLATLNLSNVTHFELYSAHLLDALSRRMLKEDAEKIYIFNITAAVPDGCLYLFMPG